MMYLKKNLTGNFRLSTGKFYWIADDISIENSLKSLGYYGTSKSYKNDPTTHIFTSSYYVLQLSLTEYNLFVNIPFLITRMRRYWSALTIKIYHVHLNATSMFFFAMVIIYVMCVCRYVYMYTLCASIMCMNWYILIYTYILLLYNVTRQMGGHRTFIISNNQQSIIVHNIYTHKTFIVKEWGRRWGGWVDNNTYNINTMHYIKKTLSSIYTQTHIHTQTHIETKNTIYTTELFAIYFMYILNQDI